MAQKLGKNELFLPLFMGTVPQFFCTFPIDWWPGLVYTTMDKGLPYLNYIWIRKRGRDLLLVLLLSILERLLFFSPFFWEEGIARLVLRFVFVPNEFFKSSICRTLGWVQFWKSQYNIDDERQILQTSTTTTSQQF